MFMHSEDLNSMQFSIENRSPFLDTNLIQYLFNVKGEQLLNECKNKYILRSSLDGILNKKVLSTLNTGATLNTQVLNSPLIQQTASNTVVDKLNLNQLESDANSD